VGHEDGAAVRALVAAALLALAIAASACGEKEEESGASPDELTVMLDYFVNPDHVGIFTALERGYFEEAGLDVKVEVPSDPADPVKLVAAGRADIGVTYTPEVLISREQDLDVVAIAAIVDEPLTSMMWIAESGVGSVADLEGGTVITAGIPYQTNFMRAIAEEAGIDPESLSIPDQGFDLVSGLVAGSADASLGAFPNIEGVVLERRGLGPTIQVVDELGIPTYDELVLVANGATLAENGEPYRLFIQALERGTREAIADPEAATETIIEAGYEVEPDLVRAQIDATLPLLRRSDGERYGEMDIEEWEDFGGFMYDEGMLKARPVVSEALTNEYIPGPIP
jgi:putative hydroxymethylpyrimidine transport system substrate-binding protein